MKKQPREIKHWQSDEGYLGNSLDACCPARLRRRRRRENHSGSWEPVVTGQRFCWDDGDLRSPETQTKMHMITDDVFVINDGVSFFCPLFMVPSFSGVVTLGVGFCWRKKNHINHVLCLPLIIIIIIIIIIEFKGHILHCAFECMRKCYFHFLQKAYTRNWPFMCCRYTVSECHWPSGFGKLTSFDGSSYRRQRSLAGKKKEEEEEAEQETHLSLSCGAHTDEQVHTFVVTQLLKEKSPRSAAGQHHTIRSIHVAPLYGWCQVMQR